MKNLQKEFNSLQKKALKQDPFNIWVAYLKYELSQVKSFTADDWAQLESLNISKFMIDNVAKSPIDYMINDTCRQSEENQCNILRFLIFLLSEYLKGLESNLKS